MSSTNSGSSMRAASEQAARLQAKWTPKGHWLRHRELPRAIRFGLLHGEQSANVLTQRSSVPCSHSQLI